MTRGGGDTLRVVVLGYVVRGPLGGLTWHHLQYLLGLCGLGHAVAFVEMASDPWSCYDPVRDEMADDPSPGLRYAAEVFDRVGLGDRWAFHHGSLDTWHGPMADTIVAWARDADLVVNVSGVNDLPPWLWAVPVRVLIDTDPLFTQVRHLIDDDARASAAGHTHFATFGESISTGTSTVPDDGFPWFPTRQPVVLDQWPVTRVPYDAPLTTVMQWDSYPAIEHGGYRYGMKSASFEQVIDLPRRVSPALELAVGSPTTPRDRLREHGWHLTDPIAASKDPWRYQEYLAGSLAEFAVVKHGYLASRCGWFSERSACYLASGRAVITQDTGWTTWLPHGEGLVTFDDLETAQAAIEAVVADPTRHGNRAREIAAAHFDSRRVLGDLLAAVSA